MVRVGGKVKKLIIALAQVKIEPIKIQNIAVGSNWVKKLKQYSHAQIINQYWRALHTASSPNLENHPKDDFVSCLYMSVVPQLYVPGL